MNCPKCNIEIEDGAFYCDVCGAALSQEEERYTVFSYHSKFARKNGASVSFGGFVVKATLMMIPPGVAAVICPLFESEIGQHWRLIPLGLLFLALSGVISLAIAKAPYFNAPQQAIVLDKEKQMHYLVRSQSDQKYGWDIASRSAVPLYDYGVQDDASRKAQMDAFWIQLVMEHQEGQHRPSSVLQSFVGLEFSVIELTQLKAIMKTEKVRTYSYMDKNGRRKKVLIPNAFPSLKF